MCRSYSRVKIIVFGDSDIFLAAWTKPSLSIQSPHPGGAKMRFGMQLNIMNLAVMKL